MAKPQHEGGTEQKTGTESVPPSETTQIEKQVEDEIHNQQPPPPPQPKITPFPDEGG
jgi:hypothetical protein